LKHSIVSLAVFHSLILLPACDSASKAADKPAEVAAKDAPAPAPVASADASAAANGDPAAPAVVAAAPAGKSATSTSTSTTTSTSVRTTTTGPKAGAVAADGDARTSPPKPASPVGPERVEAAPPAAPPAADSGESLGQKEGWANYAKELKRKTDAVNAKCGGKLSGSYDKSTYTDFDPMKDRTQSACQQAVDSLTAICATDPGKEAVAKLTRATCKFSTSGTGASRSGTTLVIKIDPVKSSIAGKEAGSYSWASAIKEVL